MAYSGYLIKCGSTNIPLTSMLLGTYLATPDQMLDLDSGRDTTGVMHRTALSHTATKVEFYTPPFTESQWSSLWSIISGAFSNSAERKLSLTYYDTLTGAYKTGTFYCPDIEFTINRIKGSTIYYDPIRVAFVEY